MGILDRLESVLKEVHRLHRTGIYPNLKYTQGTVKAIVNQIIRDVTPVLSYLKINKLTDMTFKWDSIIEVDSFRSLKGSQRKYRLNPNGTRKNSPYHDDLTLSSRKLPITNTSEDTNSKNNLGRLSIQEESKGMAPDTKKKPTTFSLPTIHNNPPTSEIVIPNDQTWRRFSIWRKSRR